MRGLLCSQTVLRKRCHPGSAGCHTVSEPMRSKGFGQHNPDSSPIPCAVITRAVLFLRDLPFLRKSICMSNKAFFVKGVRSVLRFRRDRAHFCAPELLGEDFSSPRHAAFHHRRRFDNGHHQRQIPKDKQAVAEREGEDGSLQGAYFLSTIHRFFKLHLVCPKILS